MTQAADARILDLLAERATDGLAGAEQSELSSLLARHPELDDDSFELAAAAIELACVELHPQALRGAGADEGLPGALRDRLLVQAEDFFAGRSASGREPGGGEVNEDTASTVVTFPQTTTEPGRGAAKTSPDPVRWMGWLAAAAFLAFAILSRMPAVETPPPAPAAGRDALLGTADALEVAWSPTEDPAAAGAGGDVLWSTQQQTGFMRFRGLPVNDPAVSQYQLWIFDTEQDERYPIDGGVFDVTESGEVVVPIDPKIAVARPTLFAITIEKPGGVVVSSRERLVLVASVS